MKNQIVIVLLVVLAGCVLNSCIKDSLGLDVFEKIPHEAVILPLEIGNYWRYKITLYNEDNKSKEESEQLYTIIDKISINEEIWYIQDQGLPPPSVLTYLTNRNDGLWQKSTPNSEPLRITQYPVVYDKSFKVGSFFNPSENKYYDIKREAVSVNNLINTQAGRFKTICYLDFVADGDIIYQDTLNIIFYAPNKGLILRMRYKQKTHNNELYLYERWELIEYNTKILHR